MVSSSMSWSEREGTPWCDGMGGRRLDDDCATPGLRPRCWLRARAFRIRGTWYAPTARIPTAVKPPMRRGMLMGELDDNMGMVVVMVMMMVRLREFPIYLSTRSSAHGGGGGDGDGNGGP